MKLKKISDFRKNIIYPLIGTGVVITLLASPSYDKRLKLNELRRPEVNVVDFIPLYGMHKYIHKEKVVNSFNYWVDNFISSISNRASLDDIVTLETLEKQKGPKYSVKLATVAQNIFMASYHIAIPLLIIFEYLGRRKRKLD